MSAGSAGPAVNDSLDGLAPKFRQALEASLAECNDQGLDAIAYETLRSEELQRLYWTRGRPPSAEYPEPVTNVRSAQYGWHFFGLAADVISLSDRWDVSDQWRESVNSIMRAHGLSCGADWPRFKDLPHVQWGKCRRSPSDYARELYQDGGNPAVWAEVGAA